jgi:hypothetical protein
MLRPIGLALLVLSLVLPVRVAAAGSALGPSARVRAYPADDYEPKPGKAHNRAFARLIPDPDALAAAKYRAAHESGPSEPAGPTAPSGPSPDLPATSVFGQLNQPGLAATDNTPANNGSPPDSTGAIGPSHYVEFVNAKVGAYDRSDLSPVALRDLDAFVGKAGDDVFDPQIQWDQTGGRWLYVAVDVDPLGHNFLAFGWSKNANPTDLVGGWCRFVVNTDLGGRSGLDDYPKLGHDNSHIIFGANAFRGNSFLTAHVWSVAKPANGDTSCSTPSAPVVFGSTASPLLTADNNIVLTPVPVNTSDSSSNGYVVAADSPLVVASPNQIMAWHVSGPAASPTLIQDGNMNVTGFAIPADVPQPGTTKVIDSADARLTQAVAHADPDAASAEAIWTQHTVNGPGGRSVVRWYELLPASLTVRQQGTIQDASNFAFNGAISPATVGSSAVINYNLGGSSLLAQIRAQSRESGMTLGQMANEIVIGTSAAADQDFTCTAPYGPPCRWGDYAGASPDPVDDHTVWGSNQVNGPFTSDPHWQTRNFAILEGASPGYPRPKGATPLRVSLALAYDQCTGGNRTHGGPLAVPSCNPPVQSSGFLTVGTLDANGAAANSVASLRLDAIQGDPATPPDEADLRLRLTATDVRLKSGLADYTGELLAAVTLRMTDRNNGPSQTEPATASDLDYSFTVPCQATADPGVGATCAVVTTADSIAPGTVLEGKRSNWQLGQARLYDGGPDAVAATADNTLFEVQGLFVP